MDTSKIIDLLGLSSFKEKITSLIPTKISQFINDSGYINAESDPTVPSWAKQPTKPTYSKSEIELGNVDNTSDASKPVSTAQQSAIDAAYQQSTGYTDQKIADLINCAPSTLDTLGEVADAMEDNEEVVSALEAAIGTKASQAELDGHINNNTIHITASEKQAWDNKENAAIILDGSLAAGETTLTFTDSAITDNSMVDIYTSAFGINPSAIEQSENTLTLTFDAQAETVGVKERVI